jgi:putative hydrolase of the HAD superfamily
MRRHTLLIDADDTLWENNVFFEKLIEDFISLVEPYGYTRAYIRHILGLAGAVTLLGSIVPLRRASRIEPAPILRGE